MVDGKVQQSAGAVVEAASAAAGEPYMLQLHSTWAETGTLLGIRLGASEQLLQQYSTPGQYLEIVHHHRPLHGHHQDHGQAGRGYFALAAAPQVHSGQFELLVRRSSLLATALQHSEQQLQTSGIQGQGFALDAAAGHNLLLVATGSGIAPLRATLQQLFGSRRERERFGHIALLYGERSMEDFAYLPELQRLTGEGLQLSLVSSQQRQGHSQPSYVQHRLQESPPTWLGGSTTVLLCGQPLMLAETTQVLLTHGVPAGQILRNY